MVDCQYGFRPKKSNFWDQIGATKFSKNNFFLFFTNRNQRIHLHQFSAKSWCCSRTSPTLAVLASVAVWLSSQWRTHSLVSEDSRSQSRGVSSDQSRRGCQEVGWQEEQTKYELWQTKSIFEVSYLQPNFLNMFSQEWLTTIFPLKLQLIHLKRSHCPFNIHGLKKRLQVQPCNLKWWLIVIGRKNESSKI